MIEKDSALVQIVSQPQLVDYRTHAGQSAENSFLKLRDEYPELYAELMKLAKKELGNAIVVQTESKFDWSRSLRNEIEVEEDEQRHTYVGEAFELRFEGTSIRGNATLTKFRKDNNIKKKLKVVNWFLPKIEIRQQEQVSYQELWKVQAGDFAYEYLLDDGNKNKYGYEHSFYYKGALNDKLLNRGLKISRQLFEKVFTPIDAELVRIYYESKRMQSP